MEDKDGIQMSHITWWVWERELHII